MLHAAAVGSARGCIAHVRDIIGQDHGGIAALAGEALTAIFSRDHGQTGKTGVRPQGFNQDRDRHGGSPRAIDQRLRDGHLSDLYGRLVGTYAVLRPNRIALPVTYTLVAWFESAVDNTV